MFEFRFESGSGVPPYLQLVRQVEDAVRLGELRRGEQLPTVKEVARRLVVNPNTVQKAYRELDRRGVVRAKPGQGTFVTREAGGVSPERRTQLRASLARWLTEARAAGLAAEDVEALVSAVLREHRGDGNPRSGKENE
ncbi:GntR family transcriptional regulator [Amycolatopsis sp. NPDC051903]|uniref:GntR family transcriptional regulator n=1 Tax=Amycolatopsis sp. NPDC051903 TaxID=3363936 RepID=UPI0037A7971A